ncbi:hypothetical protein PVAND_013075 [Polypedilum vanderplanki]|uniref:Cystatin n=1 Tax=Polypedilum vanderplanki TaxID=319348 RepID=A0A9J6CQC6_POLVA|nr:hypothetical protein PVAND_013075 [Polypedilum vanderplanki]
MKIACVFFFACITAAVARDVPGGESEVTDKATKQEVQKLLEDNICSLDGCWELIKITKITSQTVAGELYRINGIFEEVQEEQEYELLVTIWSKPWMNFNEVKLVSKTQV